MKQCVLNLKDLGIANREQFILYATDEHVIYRNENQIVLASCAGDIIQSNPAPPMTKTYETVSDNNLVVFLFENKTLLFMTVDGIEYRHHDITEKHMGRITSELHLLNDKLLFTTSHYSSFQFVLYDYIGEKRIAQSRSHKTSPVSKLFVKQDKFYIIQDNSILYCYSLSNCEELWHRFEVGNINGDILDDNGRIMYTHGGKLKILNTPREVETVSVPSKKIQTLLGMSGSSLIFTHKDNKEVACFDLKEQQIKWNMNGQNNIDQHFIIKGRNENSIKDILLLRIKDNIGIIDVVDGKLLYYFQVPQLYNIRRTSNCILLHKYNGKTDILPGY